MRLLRRFWLRARRTCSTFLVPLLLGTAGAVAIVTTFVLTPVVMLGTLARRR